MSGVLHFSPPCGRIIDIYVGRRVYSERINPVKGVCHTRVRIYNIGSFNLALFLTTTMDHEKAEKTLDVEKEGSDTQLATQKYAVQANPK